jgi:hypothetical protein
MENRGTTATTATTTTTAMQQQQPNQNTNNNSSQQPTNSIFQQQQQQQDDNNSVLDISEQTLRPIDNAFNQQRVNAWHPILDPVYVIIALFYLGVIMIPVGKLYLYIYLFK